MAGSRWRFGRLPASREGFGAKNNVVFGILSYDSVAITVAATVFAILLLLIVKVIGVAYISQLAYIGFGKTILLTTAMGIGFSLFVMLVTWLLLRRTVRKDAGRTASTVSYMV